MAFPHKPDLNIACFTCQKNSSIDFRELPTPPHHGRYLDSDSRHVRVHPSASFAVSDYDKILIWKAKALLDPRIMRNLEKTEMVDKDFYLMKESDAWKEGYYSTFSQTEKRESGELSIRNYIRLRRLHPGNRKAYCFLTGPTFSTYRNLNFEEHSVKIICNSIVINDEFNAYIQGPDVITFSDPSFHFSACTYASEFRKHVMKVVDRYNSFVAVPESTVPLLLHHFPRLEKNLIGLGLVDHFNIPDADNLNVHVSRRRGNSIITLMMIPLASSLSRDVFFVGADGRAKGETYFWKHNKSVQLNDQMESVFRTHPSFFRDHDYAAYYDKHCRLIERQLAFGESRGIRYHSLTESHIPAFRKRWVGLR